VLRGGFPRSFVASTLAGSLRWRQGFIDTFLERTFRSLGARAWDDLASFWSMLAHVHGQILNWSNWADPWRSRI